jgi:hypothetical protein
MKPQKSVQNATQNTAHTRHVADTPVKRGSKRASPLLRYILEMANLVPREADPLGDFPIAPEEAWRIGIRTTPQVLANRLRASIGMMPDPLRGHMLEYLIERMAVPDTRTLEHLPPKVREEVRGLAFGKEVVDHYREIRQWRENLLRISRGEFSVLVRAVLQPDKKKKVRIVPDIQDVFLVAVDGTDFGYIRQCPVCGRLFYAVRSNQAACTPETCAITLRKRKERANTKLRAEIEAKRKKRASKRA